MFVWLLTRVTSTVDGTPNLFMDGAITAISKIPPRYSEVAGEDVKELYYKQA